MSTIAFYRQALRSELTRRIERNPRYSLRAFARSLGLSHASLTQVLSGDRLPSVKLAEKILAKLELDPTQERAFRVSLADTKIASKPQRLSPEIRAWARLGREERDDGGQTAEFPAQDLSLELFRTIADWYHTAILEMTSTETFVPNPRVIASRLGISQAEASLAIERMVELGILEQTRDSLVRTNPNITTTDKQLTTAAHRRRQRQILEKSLDALENVAIERRNHSAMTMAIDPDRVPEAKRMIQEFARQLCAHLEGGPRRVVYEFQTSLFPLEVTSYGEVRK